jgi:hypothetical protein
VVQRLTGSGTAEGGDTVTVLATSAVPPQPGPVPETGSAGLQTCPQDPCLFHPASSFGRSALPEHDLLLDAQQGPSLNALRVLASAVGLMIAGYSFPIDVCTAKAF